VTTFTVNGLCLLTGGADGESGDGFSHGIDPFDDSGVVLSGVGGV
jgi:hypothetical protein